MKKNKVLFSIITAILFLNSQNISASADDTYALLDSNGNVLNIIICGSACEPGGVLASPNTVKQIAEDPVTKENRGGLWYGPNTTSYDFNTGTFSATDNSVTTTIKTLSEEENGTTVISSATISGRTTTQFKYEDTIGSNLFTRNGFVFGYTEDTKATISVTKDSVTELLNFESRLTADNVQKSVENSNLLLLNSKIQTLISLLGVWIK